MSHFAFPFVQYLSINGDGTGDVNQAQAWTPAAPGFFRVQAQPNIALFVSRLVFSIADNSNFGLSQYGSIPPLTEGVQVEARFHGQVLDSFDGFRVRQNQEWFSLGETSLNTLDGPGHVLTCAIMFAPSFGIALHLDGGTIPGAGDYIGVRLRDDLSALVEQLAVCTGRIEFD
jgi:hypothetical protein